MADAVGSGLSFLGTAASNPIAAIFAAIGLVVGEQNEAKQIDETYDVEDFLTGLKYKSLFEEATGTQKIYQNYQAEQKKNKIISTLIFTVLIIVILVIAIWLIRRKSK